MRPRLSLKTVAVLGVSALAVPVMISSSFAADSPSRVSVAGSLPDWVATAHQTGTPSASTKLSVDVVLPLRDSAAAERLALSVSDPKSSAYGHYLSAAQFNARFAPTADQISSVRKFLADQGLHVNGVAQGNRWVSVSGTVTQLDKAFGITLKTWNAHGIKAIGPTATATVPRSVAPLIAGVIGLDTLSNRHTNSHVKPVTDTTTGTARANAVPATGSTPPPAQPCSTYWGQFTQKVPPTYGKTRLPTTPCGYGPIDLRKAYGTAAATAGGLNGHGVTVAILDAYANPTMLSDANTWSAQMGIPGFKPGQYTQTVFRPFGMQDECGGEVGWNEEEALDVEAVHGIAPGAKVHYVGAADCDTGLDDALNYVVQNHIATIVSDSWGNTGEDGITDVALEHSIFLQGAIEGIGFYFSSGDDGDDAIDLGHPEADFPSTDPLVTAVGGTSIAVKPNGTALFQTSWGETVDPVDFTTNPASLSEPLPGEFIFGAGGGKSKLFTQPFYQHGIVPAHFANRNGVARRATPDVALDADPETGYVVALTEPDAYGTPTFTEFVIGGTSLSCPLFAAYQALAQQNRSVPIGFANPTLYNVGGIGFTDIKNPAKPIAFSTESGKNVLVLGQDSSLVAVKGWDNTTGLGTPNGLALIVAEDF
jgi:subtilase family serine protease